MSYTWHVPSQGIQIVKQLRRMDSALKQDAEIALYLKQFDEAEMLYRRMDRPDLAVDMHMRLGDWFAVSHDLYLCGFQATFKALAVSNDKEHFAGSLLSQMQDCWYHTHCCVMTVPHLAMQ